jgi:DNA-binding GntR family transcriptional regulator
MDRAPSSLPPELAKVWEKHHDKMLQYDMEHQYNGFTERYYNLARKHERICEALESADRANGCKAALESLKQRVRELPADGEWHAMRDAVIALKNDLAMGEW